MTPFVQDADFTLHVGDALKVLRELPDGSVHCALTSPPFYGLRDYGTGRWEGGDSGHEHDRVGARGGRGGSGTLDKRSADAMPATVPASTCSCGAVYVDSQIGLEDTPEEWCARLVDVFREVHRVLRPDGTLWVECGDSYVSGQGGRQSVCPRFYPGRATGLKPKDLLGQPWLLAKALREPYYTGRIKDERDRIWLAAMVDAEGCIHIHKRKAGSSAHTSFEKADGTVSEYVRRQDTYGVMVSVSNTSEAIIDRCAAIVGRGSKGASEAGAGVQKRKQTLYRWTVTGDQARDLLRELYPHFVAKQHEARVALACPRSGDEASACQEAVKLLHNGGTTTVDYKPPASLFEQGWYLRQAIIWAKSNAMPESAMDRCTTAHSYVFLLSKSARYHFDGEAIAENAAWERWGAQTTPKYEGTATTTGWIKPKSKLALQAIAEERRGFDNRMERTDGKKHPRSVWSIPTQGYPDAHFATWPEALAERIIKSGCPEGGVCLDPFMGSGTTALVARRLGRKSIGIELSREYAALAAKRLGQQSLFALAPEPEPPAAQAAQGGLRGRGGYLDHTPAGLTELTGRTRKPRPGGR